MEALLHSYLIMAVIMLLGWIHQCITKNATAVDVIWAGLMSGASVFYAFKSDYLASSVIIILTMSAWYGRLCLYLWWRSRDKKEDTRYQTMRESLGTKANITHFFFYQFQALLAWIFSIPAWILVQDHITWNNPLSLIAYVLFATCLIGVTISDLQLLDYRQQKNKPPILKTGLWKYSRHPNYFFEWAHWFCYALLGISHALGMWLWFWPLLMLVFLVFITGIPHIERQAKAKKGAVYEEYQRTTPAFIPWFPKK